MIFRTILLVMILVTLYSSHAVAYQYGYYAPNPYSVPRAYYPYARPAYAYYPPYRYRTRPAYAKAGMPVPAAAAAPATVIDPASINTPVQGEAEGIARAVEPGPESTDKADNPFSGLSSKKQAFITMLLPYIEQENRRLLGLRKKTADMLAAIDNGIILSASELQSINRLANRYRINGDVLVDRTAREELLRKIDIIPSSLALAQAANESAWGESRFAREANNLFGIWTYDQDKGMKPERREEGKKHLVRIFDDFDESVRYYMYTLNSHPAYDELREIRQQLRTSGQVIDGHKLAAGLEKYSAKGQMYINLIQGLIMQNEWARLDLANIQV